MHEHGVLVTALRAVIYSADIAIKDISHNIYCSHGRRLDASDAMYDVCAPCYCFVGVRRLLVFVKTGAYHTLRCVPTIPVIYAEFEVRRRKLSYPGLQK